jgi:hypothetical protein
MMGLRDAGEALREMLISTIDARPSVSTDSSAFVRIRRPLRVLAPGCACGLFTP